MKLRDCYKVYFDQIVLQSVFNTRKMSRCEQYVEKATTIKRLNVGKSKPNRKVFWKKDKNGKLSINVTVIFKQKMYN